MKTINGNLSENSANIHKAGYYFSINTILNKSDNSEVKALAICTTTEQVYLQNCEVEKIMSISGGQDESDLVYISKGEEDDNEASISIIDNSLSSNKIIPRIITLTYVKAYQLELISGIYNFKIEIGETGLREGLNVTVDLFRESNEYHTASCTYREKILSCVRDKTSGQQDEELFYLTFEKRYGSVTWNELSTGKEKIPWKIVLTHSESYYLSKDGTQYTFKLKASAPTDHGIPANSLIEVDISYGAEQKITAKCEENSRAAKLSSTTFSCNFEYTGDDNPVFKVNNNVNSVSWSNFESPFPIDEKIELTFVKAYNMKLTWKNDDKKWSFDIDFTNTKNINLKTTDTYKVEISYPLTGTSKYTIQADCQLSGENSNTFNCRYANTSPSIKDYILSINKEATKTDSKNINWIGGITEDYQMDLNTELTFVKGTLNYNTKWILNIDVQVATDSTLPNKSKLFVGIIEGTTEKTLECIAESNVLKCETTISDESAGSLPTYTLKRDSTTSTITWKNAEIEDVIYYFYLTTQLDFNSATNMIFSNNKWQFKLITSDFPDKTKIIIDILYNNEASTATCVKESEILCTVNKDSQSSNSLVKINHNKGSTSTITWNELSEDKDIYMETTLNVESVGKLSYKNTNKWEFLMYLTGCDLPLNSAVKIDIDYSGASTATCILKSSNILTCMPDKDPQSDSDSFTITHSKNLGTVSYTNTVDKLEIKSSKNLAFQKACDLTLIGTKWEFKVELTNTNLNNGDSINIDVKLNGIKKVAQCTLNTLILTCTIDKVQSSDRIILINDDSNQDLLWTNFDEEKELYVLYEITFVNIYGGFHNNKWEFNLKYDTTANTISAIDNYALLDILVDSAPSIAKCKIKEKFLLCESQHDAQDNEDIVKIYGSVNLGTVSFSAALVETQKSINPISLILEETSISNFDYSNNMIKFKINGNLKNDVGMESEIAENTISKVDIIVIKKDETKNDLEAICLTNTINNSPVELNCEASGTMNKNEDNVEIKVDSDGKSSYVTFSSVTENIEIFNSEKGQEQEEGSDSKKKRKRNNGIIIKSNYILLFGLFLLF